MICKVSREMSTATLPSEARRNVALFTLADSLSFKPRMRFGKSRNPAGEEVDALILEDVPVFRTGTFRDSMGFQHTWETIHIDQMVSHFDLLRTRSIFKDVPVRKGHGALFGDPIDNLIGWHSGLRSELRTNQVDGQEYLFLLGNYEILDPDAMTKISSGLWRNVSAEVGSYLTNSETEFWPVYQGVAYVDIPAVEGLSQFSKNPNVGKTFSIFLPDGIEKEAPVGTENNGTQQGTTSAPQMDPAMFARANFTFTIGGRQTNDFSAVQAHITNVEGQLSTMQAAADEAKKANRSSFIKGLAEGPTPKILAGQIEQIEGYALKLDDEGWGEFEKSWGVAPALPHTAMHGAQATGQPPASVPQGTPAGQAGSEEIEVAAGIVRQHRLGNMPKDKLERTASFQKLKQLDPNHPALTGR